MNSKLANRVALHLNKPDILSTLNEYVHDRVSILQRDLIVASDPVMIYRIQGQIQELQKILKIRENALAVLELLRGDAKDYGE